MVVDYLNVDGAMSYGHYSNGQHGLDFLPMEPESIEMEPWAARCKVQCTRGGYVFVTELPRRVRNKPLYREDNATFSHGRDGKWYFTFSMEEDELYRLPDALARQAKAIAKKVKMGLVEKGENK